MMSAVHAWPMGGVPTGRRCTKVLPRSRVAGFERQQGCRSPGSPPFALWATEGQADYLGGGVGWRRAGRDHSCRLKPALRKGTWAELLEKRSC